MRTTKEASAGFFRKLSRKSENVQAVKNWIKGSERIQAQPTLTLLSPPGYLSYFLDLKIPGENKSVSLKELWLQ